MSIVILFLVIEKRRLLFANSAQINSNGESGGGECDVPGVTSRKSRNNFRKNEDCQKHTLTVRFKMRKMTLTGAVSLVHYPN